MKERKAILYFILKSMVSVVLGIIIGILLLNYIGPSKDLNIGIIVLALMGIFIPVFIIKLVIDVIIYFIANALKISFLPAFLIFFVILLIPYGIGYLQSIELWNKNPFNIVLFVGLPAKLFDYYILRNGGKASEEG